MLTHVTTNFIGNYDNRQVNKYCIKQANGMGLSVINYGATVTNIIVADKFGNATDVVLGFKTLDGYVNAKNVYMGSICGRYANRIADAKFCINNKAYHLTKNDGENNLHGGIKGFDKVFWEAAILPDNDGVAFTYNSKDGEEGFPGNVTATVVYRLRNDNVEIDFEAVTDKATPVNFTNHSYFNLSGGKENNILNHYLQLYADNFLEVNENKIPTGNYLNVENTAKDFLQSRSVGEALHTINGYDHCWVINKQNNNLQKAALLFYEENGIAMTVYTTQPGIHFYSSNFLTKQLKDTKNKNGYEKYAGLCLETQHFPDSPNKINFPNTILQPGETYFEKVIYSFSKIQ